jgi:TPR repeat protein
LLSKLVGTAQLEQQIGAALKAIYRDPDQAVAAEMDAYLSYLFCSLLESDASLGQAEKLAAIEIYRRSTTAKAETQSSEAHACESLAASPYDSSRPADIAGVEFNHIDAHRAETACRSAVNTEASPRLQYALARALEAGGQSLDEAVRLYRQATDEGFAPAQSNLGWLYEHGKAVGQSDPEAVRFYQLAADQGFAPAQFQLALMHDRGKRGLHNPDAEIVKLLRLAADQGFAPAQGALGLMFEQGRGVTQSYSEAIRLYRLAAEHGVSAATERLKALTAAGHTGQP